MEDDCFLLGWKPIFRGYKQKLNKITFWPTVICFGLFWRWVLDKQGTCHCLNFCFKKTASLCGRWWDLPPCNKFQKREAELKVEGEEIDIK